MSFLRFSEGSDEGLHWSRADRDGAPFKGPKVIPLLKEEEYEELAQRVPSSKNGTFDTSDPEYEQNGRTYKEVLDGVKCGWFTLLCERQYRWGEKDGKPVMYVYIEWDEATMQLPQSVIQKLTTTIAPLEDEVRYAQSKGRSNSQPRPLRSEAS